MTITTVGSFEEFGNDQVGDQLAATLEDLDAEAQRGREGTITKSIEKRTSSLPSGTFLALAGGAMIGSFVLELLDRGRAAKLVGGFVPTFLLLGIYNKLVKIHGSDRDSI